MTVEDSFFLVPSLRQAKLGCFETASCARSSLNTATAWFEVGASVSNRYSVSGVSARSRMNGLFLAASLVLELLVALEYVWSARGETCLISVGLRRFPSIIARSAGPARFYFGPSAPSLSSRRLPSRGSWVAEAIDGKQSLY